MTLTLTKIAGPSPWTWFHDNLRTVGCWLGCMALGMWIQSAIDKSSTIPWLWSQQSKLTKVETVEIPKLKSVAGCQTVRAQVATNQAIISEHGGNVDFQAIPNCPKLPAKVAK